jgi:hypothetical protein
MTWTVVSWNAFTLFGCVSNGIQTIGFHAPSSFHSATSFRWPRVGEPVEVVFNHNGDLLSVHGA